MIENRSNLDEYTTNKFCITAEEAYIDDRTHVLNHCDTFGVMSRTGDILPLGKEIQGIYHRDTRYINKLTLEINGRKPTLLSSNIKEENEILSVDLTNPEMEINDGTLLPQGSLHIHRSQLVRNGRFNEKLEIVNHDAKTHEITVLLTFGGDFRDIFEVRGLKREKRGKQQGFEVKGQNTMLFSYEGLDKVIRKSQITFNQAFHEVDQENGKAFFLIKLEPKINLQIDYSISFQLGNELIDIKNYQIAREHTKSDIEKTKQYFPVVETSNEQFNHWINRSQADLVSLMSDMPTGKYPYAGVPWYNTAFGRDGIITALETLWLAPKLSRDVLLYLASQQADTLDEAMDAEPGKIMHETRRGEMVALREVPFEKYYGTIDATPLFVVLAGEYYQRTADMGTIKKIWPNILRAVEWINLYGDLDGDFFVEYQHKSSNGLTNQGWKDSYDSVFHLNGKLAEPPIALCEVQGYVYAAKIQAAQLAQLFGEKTLAETWRREAKALKEKFNEVFWDKELGSYVLALDGNKAPCRVKSSNAGQVLFSGIADPGKAKKMVQTLLGPDLFNGWGIRTLSSEEIRYNPFSYHNGSVWPHDVALIADGMGRYGFQQEALKLMTGLFDASLFIPLQRLPELFCGNERRRGEGPTAYPVACSPQAWSVASVFMFLKAILQINVNAQSHQLTLNKPLLPAYLEYAKIKELELGDLVVNLEMNRHGQDNMIGVNWNYSGEDWKLIVIK